MDVVQRALDDDDPVTLLGVVSTLLTSVEEQSPISPPAEPPLPPLAELVDAFFEVPAIGTSALLAGIAGLTRDDMLRRRVRREIAARGHVLPRWLVALDTAELMDPVMHLQHVLGDGESILLGVRLPGGHEICAAVYVDHNLGTLVKDALVVPGSLSELVDVMAASADDPDTTLADLDPAVARARINEAIELGRITFPPIETDTWPGSRPFVEWAIGLLPDGGAGYLRPDWSDGDKQALADRFFSSPFGAGLDDGDHRSLLDSLLWFGTDYGPGDPLRWSPVAVEILLADWIPRKIVADVPFLAQAPGLLRAFIRFCHAERGIRPELTGETLTAVDELEDDYQTTIRSPRPQGPTALLAAIGMLDPNGPLPDVDDLLAGFDPLKDVADAVGGSAALDALDAAPLPDEAFHWEQIADDVREPVGKVLELVDRCCTELLDVELRTAARRLLARVADTDPDVFRRRTRLEGTAAAVCWVVATANHVFRDRDLTVKQLTGWFGIAGSPSARAKPLLTAIGVTPDGYAHSDGHLGSPDYLTGEHRAHLLAARNRLRS